MSSADPFLLPVTFKGQSIQLEASLQRVGYTHRVSVLVEGVEIFFEPDEERNYRARLADPEAVGKPVDKELLQVIVETLEELFR